MPALVKAGQGRAGAELLPLAQPQLPKPQAVPFSLNFIVTVVYQCLQFLVHEFQFFWGGGGSVNLVGFGLQIIFWQCSPV